MSDLAEAMRLYGDAMASLANSSRDLAEITRERDELKQQIANKELRLKELQRMYDLAKEDIRMLQDESIKLRSAVMDFCERMKCNLTLPEKPVLNITNHFHQGSQNVENMGNQENYN